MGEFLPTLLSLSLGGGLAALSRLKCVHISSGWRRFVWILLFARLAVPVSLYFPVLIRLPLPREWEKAEHTAPTAPTEGEENPQLPGDAPPDASIGDTGDEGDRADVPYPLIVFLVWVSGAAGTGLWLLIRHLRFARFVRRWAVPVEDRDTLSRFASLAEELGLKRRPRLLRCPGLRSPVLAGVWRCVLLLPWETMAEKELRFTLLHELTHYQRRDLCIRALALWVNPLHWFNPLMWAAVGWAEQDMELACDQRLLRSLTPEEAREYGRTLLALSTDNQ